MADRHRTSCACPTCGAQAEPLLHVSGAFADKLGVHPVGSESLNGRHLLFRDILREPFRLPWRPQMTLLAGVTPTALVLVQKVAFEAIQVLAPPQFETSSALSSTYNSLTGLMPWVLGTALLLSVVAAGVQFLANERYIERQAWLERLADRIDALRARAQGVVACSYCNSLHSPGGRRDATAQGLADILGSPGQAQDASDCGAADTVLTSR